MSTSALGLRAAAILVLAVVLGLGLLYAFRAQTPAVAAVPLSQAVAAVQDGRVRGVEIAGGRATLDLVDGTRQQTVRPEQGGDPLTAAIAEYNARNPSRQVEVRFVGPDPFSPLFAILASLLPLLTLVVLVLAAAAAFARARAPDPYERLARIADLRDRGVLTEEELQREKRRLLR